MSDTPTFMKIQEEIANMLDIPDDELSDEQKQAMDLYLNELAQQEASKVDAFAGFIRKQAAIAEAVKEESQHLAAKARAMQNKIDHMKGHYLAVMRIHGLKKINGDVYSIGLREITRVEVRDIEALKKYDNPEYIKTEVTYKPDKANIKEALKNGVAVPGCQLEKGYSLNIR